MTTKTLEVVMPQMGEAISEAVITAWHRKVGEEIQEGEKLLDISTAKVEVEIPAPASGVIAKVMFKEGDTVPVDTVIALLAPKGTDKAELQKIEDAPLVAEEAGDDDSGNGRGSESGEGHLAGLSEEDRERERRHLQKRRSSPLVRNMAQQLGIDLGHVSGTGIHGRVTRRDLELHISELKAMKESPTTIPASGSQRAMRPRPVRPDGAMRFDTVSGPDPNPPLLPPEEVNVPAMRRQIAEQMIRSVNNIPQAYTVHEVDFTQLERLRLRYKAIFETQFGARLTPLVFLVRAVADALLACPYINASWGGDRILLHRNVNIGLAVAIHGGLVVPTLKCVETMSLAGIARGIRDLAIRARDGKLKPADMEHATFTITSPGQLGATLGIPIVNRPQGGILHFGAIQKVPAVITGPDGEDSIAIRQRAMLTLGIDHRLIDGWEADKFMIVMKERIEQAEFGLPA